MRPLARRRRARRYLALFALSGVACERQMPADMTSPPASNRIVGGEAPLSSGVHTIDDEFAALSDEVPGFGGLYYDAEGRLTILMREPATFESNKARIVAFLVKQVRDKSGPPPAS